jgi:hypothetical protein
MGMLRRLSKYYNTKLLKAQSSNRQRQAPTLQKMEWRANAMTAEKERSKAKVAGLKLKTNLMMSQKENVLSSLPFISFARVNIFGQIILQPEGPQVIKGKAIPNRVEVSYTSTRFHETMANEKPDSPAKNPPLPTPRDPVHLCIFAASLLSICSPLRSPPWHYLIVVVEENAYTTAIAIEQAELMRADQEREEQTRKALALKQRTMIAHNKFIAERVLIYS